MVHNLSKNESPSPHMIWSPAAFLPHFLPVPALFTLCLPHSFLISWTHQAHSFWKPWCVAFSLPGELFFSWLCGFFPQSFRSHPQKNNLWSLTNHSCSPAHHFLFPYPALFFPILIIYQTWYILYICFFIHLFPLTYHSMRTEIRFPLLYTST